MKSSRFLIPLIVSLIATPLLLFGGVASGGAGHGHYVFAKIFFPFTMLSTILFGSIIGPFIALAIVQFPLYGLLIGTANEKRRVVPYAAGLVIVHALAVVACFLLVRENLS
jgi:hypothetical protein